MKAVLTQHAPAERASEAQIRQDADIYVNVPLVTSVLDAVPDLLLVLNSERQTVYANEACLSLLSLANREEALGQRPGELVGCVHATETEGGCGTTEFCRNCGAVNAIMSSMKGVQSVQECSITLRNGDALDLRASAKPLQINDRRFTVFTLSDISGEKRRRALERIFFHDVLNTVGIVHMSAQIMKEDPGEAVNVAGDLYRAADRLLDEIRGQQDLTAAENGEFIPEPSRFNATIFLRTLALQFSYHHLAAERHINVVETDATLMLTSDRTILGRVIANMIKNALEATEPGGTVYVSCYEEQDGITFAVNNQTVMPRNIQLQIFNRSFSTKGSGRGLGTYSMRLLSERYLHGHVTFESTPEKGTTFFATYPYEWPTAAENAAGK